MDIELNTLLVALMFVTILSMGIGNILVTLADILNHTTSSRRTAVHVSWIAFLLMTHFNLFWHTKEILRVEHWQFEGFLLAIAGPVLLFFATSVLLSQPSEEELRDLQEFFRRLARPFFLMFAILQVWVLFAGYTMSGGWVAPDALVVVLVVLALVLAFTDRSAIVRGGTVLAWLLAVGIVFIRFLGDGST